MKYFKLLFIYSGLLAVFGFGGWFISTGIIHTRAQTESAPENTGEAETFEGEYKFPDGVCLTEEKRAEIKLKIRENIEKLRAQGKLPDAPDNFVAPSFIFPLRGNGVAASDPGVHGISNFVDQNLSFPNALRDYNCGTRTYDTSAGYNHKGIDFFTWPFPWNKMDNDEVAIMAADAGTIILKSDGNPDRSCSSNNNNWNAVFIRHSGGTVSWYGHMKLNSLTTKNVGDTVVKGEFLGIVGSSGNSTGPHLHFELYDPVGALHDPNVGACNTMSSIVYWESQLPYRDSKINKLMTHSAAPFFGVCPSPAEINEKRVFLYGEPIIVAAYYHDQVTGLVTNLSLVRPNGTIYTSWTHTGTSTSNASFWFTTRSVDSAEPSGIWKFRAVYQGVTYEREFTIRSDKTQFDYDGDRKSDISIFRPSNGVWYVQNSSNGTFAINQFGASGDLTVPADYDGDDKADVAIYRPANGLWYWLNSSNGQVGGNQFGTAGDTPAPGDYDGDGRSDIAIFRPSTGTWWVYRSSDNGVSATQFGIAEDKPVLGDFDGDSKNDFAVFRPSNGTWYRLNSSNGAFVVNAFGLSEDKPVAADYDNDGKADIAVFRPSNGAWYWVNSGNDEVGGVFFGISEDKPVPGDYDGDGRYDPAVFRPSQGTWYVLLSGAGFIAQQFGTGTDIPTPNSFVQ